MNDILTIIKLINIFLKLLEFLEEKFNKAIKIEIIKLKQEMIFLITWLQIYICENNKFGI